jgi:hypothetical protein
MSSGVAIMVIAAGRIRRAAAEDVAEAQRGRPVFRPDAQGREEDDPLSPVQKHAFT